MSVMYLEKYSEYEYERIIKKYEWYMANRLSLNVKKTKMTLAGSRTKLSTFQNIEFKLDGEPVSWISEFKYLGIMLDEKWNWNSHIGNQSRKLGHRLSIFSRLLHFFFIKTHV